MSRFLNAWSISARLYFLVILFACSLLAIGLVAVGLQWQALLGGRQTEISALAEAASGVLASHRALMQSGTLTEAAAKAAALAQIGAMRFEHGNYLFVLDARHRVLQHGDPKQIGEDRTDARDPSGFNYTADVMPRARRDGVAFVTYDFIRSGEKEAVKKLSIYRYDPAWEWTIATGVYVDDLEAAFWSTVKSLASWGLVAIVVMVVLAQLIIRSIVHPLTALRGAMAVLATGDNTVEVPFSALGGEVGAMARTVVGFKDAALEAARLERNAAALAQEAAALQRRAAEAAAAIAAEQGALVSGLAGGLALLAKGDLTFRLPAQFAAQYDSLVGDFNAALGQMEAALGVIVETTNGIRTGVGEITHAADDMARRTEQQAATLEQTTAALNEITGMVRQTADGAHAARQIVIAARADAGRSGDVVQGAVAAMAAIAASSRQITQIISVIDEIAFQTNLLALNAGVEAARAGDSGRGFAVVASEVRALAQRAADAAREIKALIATSSGEVDQGVKLVGEAGEALRRIANQVVAIDSAVASIASAAKSQASSLNEVNGAIGQMDQVTQQNAAMVEEATAASHSLATETEELARLTAQFRVGPGQQSASRGRRAA